VIYIAVATANLFVSKRLIEPGGSKLQRFFSTFPSGKPGVGLLLLRVLLGITILAHSAILLGDHKKFAIWTLIFGVIGITTGTLLVIGFLTPFISIFVSIAAIAISLLSFLSFPVASHDVNISLGCIMLVAVAITFLGPGAFSLDARMFGRREIIIPDIERNSKN
jgi:uncharacterized membrane protein YphA (DoxX/SURF4 family)